MVTASDSLEVSATARPNRHLLQFGLSTLICVVLLAAILFASLRPKPKPVLISHHNIAYPADLDQTRKAAAKRLSELIVAGGSEAMNGVDFIEKYQGQTLPMPGTERSR